MNVESIERCKKENFEVFVTEEKLEKIRQNILNVSLGMPKRFRCIFTLRNIGGSKAIDILVEGKFRGFILIKKTNEPSKINQIFSNTKLPTY